MSEKHKSIKFCDHWECACRKNEFWTHPNLCDNAGNEDCPYYRGILGEGIDDDE